MNPKDYKELVEKRDELNKEIDAFLKQFEKSEEFEKSILNWCLENPLLAIPIAYGARLRSYNIARYTDNSGLTLECLDYNNFNDFIKNLDLNINTVRDLLGNGNNNEYLREELIIMEPNLYIEELNKHYLIIKNANYSGKEGEDFVEFGEIANMGLAEKMLKALKTNKDTFKKSLYDKYEIHECEFCETSISWEGHNHNKGHIWECEKCNRTVCSSCIEENGGSVSEDVEEILCPKCLKDK